MRRIKFPSLWIVPAFLACTLTAHAEDMTGKVKKAVERSTLDQAGTKPFHLKAALRPSFERDNDSGRTGSVEIWWASPEQWKRELQAPGFHQTQIVNGGRVWQKNEGDYFPEWLNQIATALIRPVPLEQVLDRVKTAEVRQFNSPMMQQININWVEDTGTAEVHNISRGGISIDGKTGLLLYSSGRTGDAQLKDFRDFHGRKIAQKVSSGTPEVTADVTTLEDFAAPDRFFDTEGKDGDAHPIEIVMLDETALRKNLLPMEPIVWPALQDGSLEGNVTTTIVVDREGKVRETESIVSENNAVNDAGKKLILAMRFQPFLVNGVPVQAMSQITVPFKTTRPAGTETFDSARTYFERGRQVSFPAAGSGKPYVLQADFQMRSKDGALETGQYTDTWLSDTQWKRELSFAKSHYVRSRDGDKRYQSEDGPDAPVLKMIMRILEPIPATDTFTESDWRIKRDTANGVRTVRVLAGYESPEGKFDAEQTRGYWFDDTGVLMKTYFSGIESQRSNFEDFDGIKIARKIGVLKDGKLALLITVKDVTAAGQISDKEFQLHGHTWERAFTSEVR